jgi:hypothetical protein
MKNSLHPKGKGERTFETNFHQWLIIFRLLNKKPQAEPWGKDLPFLLFFFLFSTEN